MSGRTVICATSAILTSTVAVSLAAKTAEKEIEMSNIANTKKLFCLMSL
jgi:hypothetical protein